MDKIIIILATAIAILLGASILHEIHRPKVISTYHWNHDSQRMNQVLCGEGRTAAFRDSDGGFDHCFYW